MATGPHQKFQLCDVCYDKKIDKPPVAFCDICKQHFCSDCLIFHQRNRASKDHHVTHKPIFDKPIERYKDNLGERPGNGLDRPKYTLSVQECRSHLNETLKSYCKEHKVVTCMACDLVEHRNCTTVDISKLIAETNLTQNTQKILNDGEELLQKFKNLEGRYATSRTEIQLQKDHFMKEMNKVNSEQEHQINILLNDLESHFNEEVEGAIKDLQVKNDEIMRVQTAVTNQAENFKTVMEHGTGEQKCVMTLILERDIPNYCETLDEIIRNHFTVLTDKVLDKIDSFDQILKLKHADVIITKCHIQRPFQDRKTSLIGEVNIKSPATKSKIVGLEILPDYRILVCDQTQQSILLMKMNYSDVQHANQLFSLQLSSMPFSMTLMDKKTAFVSLANEQCIQKIEINNKALVILNTIKTDHEYIRIAKFEQNLLTYERTNTEVKITLINQDGGEIRMIRNDPHIQSIGFISVSSANDTIYITEKDHGCIGLSMAGDTVFKYKATGVQFYQGVFTDPEGYIYLAEQDMDNIVVINKRGEKVKDLVTMTGMQPNYLNFNEKLDKLFVVKGKMGKILVFNILKSE